MQIIIQCFIKNELSIFYSYSIILITFTIIIIFIKIVNFYMFISVDVEIYEAIYIIENFKSN